MRGRSKPILISQVTDSKTWVSEQILHADTIWGVFYDGKPVNYRKTSVMINSDFKQYKRTTFNSHGTAKRLCNKLNRLFKTDRFQAKELIPK